MPTNLAAFLEYNLFSLLLGSVCSQLCWNLTLHIVLTSRKINGIVSVSETCCLEGERERKVAFVSSHILACTTKWWATSASFGLHRGPAELKKNLAHTPRCTHTCLGMTIPPSSTLTKLCNTSYQILLLLCRVLLFYYGKWLTFCHPENP